MSKEDQTTNLTVNVPTRLIIWVASISFLLNAITDSLNLLGINFKEINTAYSQRIIAETEYETWKLYSQHSQQGVDIVDPEIIKRLKYLEANSHAPGLNQK